MSFEKSNVEVKKETVLGIKLQPSYLHTLITLGHQDTMDNVSLFFNYEDHSRIFQWSLPNLFSLPEFRAS